MQPHSPGQPGLYAKILGDAWLQLDASVRAAHLEGSADRLCASGSFEVRHSHSRLLRYVLRALRMPQEADEVAVRLVVTRDGSRETWRRSFDGREMTTIQEERAGGLLGERFGCIELLFRLEPQNGALEYQQVGTHLRLGRLTIPLPRRFSPQVTAREESADPPGRTRVLVEVFVPVFGMLIRYAGELEWERSE